MPISRFIVVGESVPAVVLVVVARAVLVSVVVVVVVVEVAVVAIRGGRGVRAELGLAGAVQVVVVGL